MTNQRKIDITTNLIGNAPEVTEELVETYLSLAEDAILSRRFPSGYSDEEVVPQKYHMLQCKLAARYFLRRGAEGEIQHNENGINRIYGSVNDEDLLQVVVPLVGGFS